VGSVSLMSTLSSRVEQSTVTRPSERVVKLAWPVSGSSPEHVVRPRQDGVHLLLGRRRQRLCIVGLAPRFGCARASSNAPWCRSSMAPPRSMSSLAYSGNVPPLRLD
jgi:hypothetical protein